MHSHMTQMETDGKTTLHYVAKCLTPDHHTHVLFFSQNIVTNLKAMIVVDIFVSQELRSLDPDLFQHDSASK